MMANPPLKLPPDVEVAGTPPVLIGDRELLLAFARFAGEEDGESREHDAEHEALVDRFLATRRPGFAIYSDAELKGVARDASADGMYHPLSERFSSLAAAQSVYPFVTSLSQSIDWCALQAAFNAAASGGGRGGEAGH